MPRNFSNTASGATLAGAIASSATSVVLDSFANYPAAPFTATLDRNLPTEEIVLVTAVSGATVTMTRAYDGTTAQAHSAGGTFEHTAIAKDFRDASAHVDAVGAVHGLTGAIVGASDVQTLTNKTVQVLLAIGTAAGAAITADSASGVTTKLLSLKQNGVEKAFVDYLGNLTAVGVTGTNASFSGTLAVTGVATLGAGATVAGAPSAATHIVPKSYADALGASAATASTIARRDASGRLQVAVPSAAADVARKDTVDGLATIAGAGRVLHAHHGSGTAFPAANLKMGDTYQHTGLVCLMQNTPAGWRQANVPDVADAAALTAISATYAASLYDGFRARRVDLDVHFEWDGTVWAPIPGAVWAKVWRTAGISAAVTANVSTKVGIDAGRQRGGFVLNFTNDTVTIPFDGQYDVTGLTYTTGGTGYYFAWNLWRTRAAVADVIAAYGPGAYKSSGNDERHAWSTPAVALKAGDVVWLAFTAGAAASYHGSDESFGLSLGLAYRSPLNGVTPI